MNVIDLQSGKEKADEAGTLYRLTDRLFRARSADDVYNGALDAITESLGCARASILLFDDSGVMRFVASRGLTPNYLKKLEGHTPWKPGEQNAEPIFVSDIEETDEANWVKATIRQEGITALGFIPLVSQGGVIGKFMTYYEMRRSFTRPEIDLAVTIARQVGFSVERSRSERARETAEHELRESEERFRLMSEHAPVMIWMSDSQGKCLHLNKLLRDFWGVSDEELPSFDWSMTMHPDDAPEIGRAIMAAMAGRSSVRIKGRYRDSLGSFRVLQTDAQPRISNGEFLGMIGVNTDITEREEADAARRRAEEHRELLMAELNHRVKNTLSVVQAIARQTFRGTDDDACTTFDGRLLALARSYDLLTHSSWSNVPLSGLAEVALQIQSQPNPRIVLRGPEILLLPRQAVSIGMAFHELMTNALKYGALSTSTGKLTVEWTRHEDPKPSLAITWREEGGPPVVPPDRKGFGTLLLQRTLTGDLNAEVALDFPPSGLVCSIRIPLADFQIGRLFNPAGTGPFGDRARSILSTD